MKKLGCMMMKTPKGWLCLLALVSLAAVSAAQSDAGYSLMVQQNLPDAGSVTPAGVQRFGLNQTVTISAEPRPGYQFVYWMGDVTDPGMMRTTVVVDSPKIVVAVFQEDEFRDLELGAAGGGDGDGRVYFGSGLNPNPNTLGVGPAVSGGSAGGTQIINQVVKEKEYIYQVPVPAPEPASLVLLSLGSTVLLRRRRKN